MPRSSNNARNRKGGLHKKVVRENFAGQLARMGELAHNEILDAVNAGVLTHKQGQALIEGKLSEVIVMRGRAQELASAKQHVKAAEQFVRVAEFAEGHEFFEIAMRSYHLAVEELRKTNGSVPERKALLKKYTAAAAKLGEQQEHWKKIGLV